ncbi:MULTISPECIES: DoxX family membrane protein [unclassified Mesorhizobium]|uniref:DoxX family membrane protein n=1 Tax=unclassified Mesorhizobium TaxID=325217 RepID=UPI003336408E
MIAVLHHLGLVLLGGVFIWAGAEHFLRFRAIAASLAERGFPAPKPLLAAGSVLEIGGGFCLATGLWTLSRRGLGRVHHCGVFDGAQLLALQRR